MRGSGTAMIKDIQLGNDMEQPCLVRLQKIGTSSNGKAYARGLLEDNSGCIPFICFEAGPINRLRTMEAPSPYIIGGKVDINKFGTNMNGMNLQVVVHKAVPTGPDDDLSCLLPMGHIDRDALEVEFKTLEGRIQHEGLHKLVTTIFSGAVYDHFLKNPAGMRLHHAYIGGLLHHTVSMTKLALAMGRTIGGVNQDLILAGSLLHDIGKLREISSQIGFPYTTEGRLLGHIAIGTMVVSRIGRQIPELDRSTLDQLLHILLSHHGDHEKGSPVFCATKEAFIVHYADELDSIMNQFDEKEGKDPWEFNKMLQRYLYNA
jgi:3'-5' exoribonuclease